MKPVRSVERAVSILFLVAQSNAPLGLSEISRSIGLDKATSLRLLNTLGDAKLVQQDPISRRYIPGSNISRLYSSWRSDIRNISRPHLESLLRDAQETVCIHAPRGLERVCIEALTPTHELCIVTTIGSAVPIYAGASGRVLMAFMPEADRERILTQTELRACTPKSVIDPDIYRRELDEVRNRGYAGTIGDVTLNTAALAAPILNGDGQIVATVTLRGPEIRMSVEKMEEIAPRVVQAAADISEEFGYGQLLAAVNT
ncbi:MAG: IclR family transcriptional regulator [Rhodospirillales bacterium]|nr:IclR family transcriptional regulator [Rhodospirillales bacterium]